MTARLSRNLFGHTSVLLLRLDSGITLVSNSQLSYSPAHIHGIITEGAVMDVGQAAANLAFLPVRLRIVPQATLVGPSSAGPGRTLFGPTMHAPQGGAANRSPKAMGADLKVSATSPATKTTYEPGEPFDFTLTLVGQAVPRQACPNYDLRDAERPAAAPLAVRKGSDAVKIFKNCHFQACK